MADMRHVDADLVRAAGLQLGIARGWRSGSPAGADVSSDLVMGDRIAAALSAGTTAIFSRLCALRAERRVDRALLAFGRSPDQAR